MFATNRCAPAQLAGCTRELWRDSMHQCLRALVFVRHPDIRTTGRDMRVAKQLLGIINRTDRDAMTTEVGEAFGLVEPRDGGRNQLRELGIVGQPRCIRIETRFVEERFLADGLEDSTRHRISRPWN